MRGSKADSEALYSGQLTPPYCTVLWHCMSRSITVTQHLHKSDTKPINKFDYEMHCPGLSELFYSSLEIKCSVAHVLPSSPPMWSPIDWKTQFSSLLRVSINPTTFQHYQHKQCKSGVEIQVLHSRPSWSCQQTDLLPVALSSFQHVEGDQTSLYHKHRSNWKGKGMDET